MMSLVLCFVELVLYKGMINLFRRDDQLVVLPDYDKKKVKERAEK